jgi:predicted nucleotidyltransferase
MLGLKEHQLDIIIKILKFYPEVERARVFGSRAKGNYKPYSDIDIAIFGPEVTPMLAIDMKHHIEDATSFPYFVDFVDYAHLSNPDMKEHIDRVGIEFYPVT